MEVNSRLTLKRGRQILQYHFLHDDCLTSLILWGRCLNNGCFSENKVKPGDEEIHSGYPESDSWVGPNFGQFIQKAA